jgi:hypothetical protein
MVPVSVFYPGRRKGTNFPKRHCEDEPLMEADMRYLLALSALFMVATTSPSVAQDYPWCARTSGGTYIGDCSFTSFGQCLATVSGQRGDCLANPRFAYGAYGWDRRWNHRGRDYRW